MEFKGSRHCGASNSACSHRTHIVQFLLLVALPIPLERTYLAPSARGASFFGGGNRHDPKISAPAPRNPVSGWYLSKSYGSRE